MQTMVDCGELKLVGGETVDKGRLLYTPDLTRRMVSPTFQKSASHRFAFTKDLHWYLLLLMERKPKMIFHLFEKVITTLMEGEVFGKSRVACGMRQTFGQQGALFALYCISS